MVAWEKGKERWITKKDKEISWVHLFYCGDGFISEYILSKLIKLSILDNITSVKL
jgi:hypothetical protein